MKNTKDLQNGYKIQSHGGIGNSDKWHNLTGSCHELCIIKNGEATRILIDMGGYQWPGALNRDMQAILGNTNAADKKVEKVVITHAHMDHIGQLLEAIKSDTIEIITTPETKKNIEIALTDMIKIEETEYEIKQHNFEKYKKTVLKPAVEAVKEYEKGGIKRAKNGNRVRTTDQEHGRKERYNEAKEILAKEGIDAHDMNWGNKLTAPAKPRFNLKDLQNLLAKIQTQSLDDGWQKVAENVEMCYFNAGHILGSASPLFRIFDQENNPHYVHFTGDIGRYNGGIKTSGNLESPENYLIETLITESTYGGKVHENFEQTLEKYQKELSEDIKKYQRVIQACFSLDRLQKILYYTIDAKKKWLIPNNIPILVDSKMGVEYIDPYIKAAAKNLQKNEKEDKELKKFIEFLSPNNREYEVLTSENRDMILSALKGKAIIISASGMAEGWPIREYIKRFAGDERTTFYFPGHLVEETLGNKLAVEQKKKVSVTDERTDEENNLIIRAKMKAIKWFSGHADERDIMRYIGSLKMATDSKILIVHGDVNGSSLALKHTLERKNFPQECIVPDLNDIYQKDFDK